MHSAMNSKLTAEGIMGAAMRMDIQEITLTFTFQNGGTRRKVR